jgi:hypothetical protein
MTTYFYTEGAIYTNFEDAKEAVKHMACAKVIQFCADADYDTVADFVENHGEHEYCSVMDAILSFDSYPVTV